MDVTAEGTVQAALPMEAVLVVVVVAVLVVVVVAVLVVVVDALELAMDYATMDALAMLTQMHITD